MPACFSAAAEPPNRTTLSQSAGSSRVRCSENPDYHLLTDANLSYSQRYSPNAPVMSQQQQFGGPQHHPGMGPGAAALGASAPHMLHMGGMGGMGMGPPPPRAGGASVTMAVPEEKVGVVIGKQVRSRHRAAAVGGRCGRCAAMAAVAVDLAAACSCGD